MLPEFRTFRFRLQSLLASEEGQDLIEYALIACLLSLAAMSAGGAGLTLKTLYTNISTVLASVA
jgi:Flp pilus assembly pilin Flp